MCGVVLLVVLTASGAASAEEQAISVEEVSQGLNTVWVLLGAFLVFFMQAGFGMVEAGFIRAKNACNILTKNFLDFCMASLGFFLIGYGLMFGDGNGFMGLKGWCLLGLEPTSNGIPLYAFWLFQAAFCGAAATIVAGGMAERMKFPAYLIYSFVISALIYPIVGHWIWGGGWLSKMGFADFAGSTIGLVAINTNLAAAMGGIVAMLTVWKRFGKPDLSMAMNGALAGLVAITASCAYVDPWAALVIGAVGGYIVVRGVEFLDVMRIDDPVGAVPVHGMCGVWGTLAVGLFGKQSLGLANPGLIYGGNPMQFGIQMIGSFITVMFVVISMGVVFKLIDKTIGLRVSRQEELRGLDIGEHGMEAYAGFQIFTTS